MSDTVKCPLCRQPLEECSDGTHKCHNCKGLFSLVANADPETEGLRTDLSLHFTLETAVCCHVCQGYRPTSGVRNVIDPGRGSFLVCDGCYSPEQYPQAKRYQYEGWTLEGVRIKPAYPIETCPECEQNYLCCDAPCGSTDHESKNRYKHEGVPCACGRGVMRPKKAKICCQRHHHHVGSYCQHCGNKD